MNKIIFLSTALIAFCLSVFSQQPDSITPPQNLAQTLLNSNQKLTIGGYGEVHYNQFLTENAKDKAILDVHRLVLFVGYNFSKKTQFISEIEYEYTNELWVEQAFLQHKLNKYMNFRAGLLLIPMGIINEYHEPTTFNGIERPLIDNKLAPSTWREIGAGFAGDILPLNMKYQAYIINGINGYNATNKDKISALKGSNLLREGRQKGSKAYSYTPSFSGKIDYYGLPNLLIGASTYLGKSQSTLYEKANLKEESVKEKVDSSVIGISLFGADARYQYKGFEARGQFYYMNISNTDDYNTFTKSKNVRNDLGAVALGYYTEIGYNVLRHCTTTEQELIPFVRYQFIDTHYKTEKNTSKNPTYKSVIISTGLTYKLTPGTAIKTDMEFTKSAADNTFSNVFNAGVAVMF